MQHGSIGMSLYRKIINAGDPTSLQNVVLAGFVWTECLLVAGSI